MVIVERRQIAIVCPDDSLRLAVARSFDHAPLDWEVTLHRGHPASADVVVGVGDEVASDVRFDPRRSELVVDEVSDVLAQRACSVVLVVGASGGCGATSIALHLAAEGPTRTCVVDLHERAPAAARLGLDPREVLEASGPVPVAGGFKLVCTGASGEPPSLDVLRRGFQRVIVDAPCDLVEPLLVSADAAVLVMLPTVTSATQAARLLDTFSDMPLALVTNRTGPGGETASGELQQILGRRLGLQLPCSRALRDAEDDCRLLTSEWSPWRRRIAHLSAALEIASR